MRACLLAIAVALAACTSAPGGGGCPTAAPDGTPGPTGTVDVQLGDAGYQGAWTVVVIDAAGTTIHAATSNGDVQVTVHPPASVTAVSTPGAYNVATVLDVQAGDHLCLACSLPDVTLVGGTRLVAPARAGTLNYSFDNGDDYLLSFDPAVVLDCAAPCTGPHDVVAIANADHGGTPAWAAAPAQTLIKGQTIDLGAWQPMATFTATYDHVGPGEIDMSRVEQSSAAAPAAHNLGLGTASLGGDAAHRVLTTPATAFGGTTMTVRTTIHGTDPGGNSMSQELVDVVPSAPSYRFDGTTDMLPWAYGSAFDLCSRTVSWTQTTGRSPDAVAISMVWSYPPHTGDEPAYGWSILAPPGATAVQLPALPASVTGVTDAFPNGDMNPPAIWLLDYAGATDYDGARSAGAAPPRAFSLNSY